jgi:hypothetical protein
LGSVQDLKYTDATVEDGKTYWYTISAVGTSGQESPRGELLKVEVKFPKVTVVKKFDFKPVIMGLVGVTQGEEWDEFKNPSDILFHQGQLFVACEDGIQVTDADGKFVLRLPLLQEKVASREWKRPFQLGLSPDDNLLVVHLGENVMRELTFDGASLVREIQLPQMSGNSSRPVLQSLTYAPDGTRWAIDGGYGNLVAMPFGSDTPADRDVERHGYAMGTGEYNPETHGDRFVGASTIEYARSWDLLLVLESGSGSISAVDLATGTRQFAVAGIGGGMNQVSLLADFLPYDDTSVLIADSLRGEIKRIKIAPGDETNGDYLANYVDDPEGKLPKLQSMAGNPNKIALDRTGKRLYALSLQAQEVAVYTLP